MSGSNRDDFASAFRLAIYIITAFGALVVFWQVSGIYAERRQNAQHRANQYAENADRRIANACTGTDGAALIECVANEVKASREDERTEYDLQAQQDSADAAFWMAVISLLSLSATIVALWFVKGTLDATREAVKDTGEATEAMREANEIASDTAKRQLRAYIGIETVGISALNVGQKPMATIRVKNFGQTPAHHYELLIFIALTGADEEALRYPDKVQRAPISLPPGGSMQGYPMLESGWSQKEAEDFAQGRLTIYIFGEATYVDAFGTKRTTAFRVKYDNVCSPGVTHHCKGGNWAD